MKNDITDSTMFIVERPMYQIIIIIENGHDIDVDIRLTAKGRHYAARRARGYHRFMRDDDDMLAEILNARDNYFSPDPPDP